MSQSLDFLPHIFISARAPTLQLPKNDNTAMLTRTRSPTRAVQEINHIARGIEDENVLDGRAEVKASRQEGGRYQHIRSLRVPCSVFFEAFEERLNMLIRSSCARCAHTR